jgi:hypothetical protein
MNKVIIKAYNNYLNNTEIEELSDIFIKNFDFVFNGLNIKHEFPPITYYLYPSEKIKIEETGRDGNAETDLDKLTVYMIYNKDIQPTGPHELVHILAKNFGIPNLVFAEGLAEYFEDYWRAIYDGKILRLNHDEWVRLFLRDNSYISINDIFDDYKFWELDESARISYPESGSFIKFLVSEHGMPKVLEAYKLMRRRPKNPYLNYDVFQKIFGISVECAEKKWLKSLSSE